MPVKPQKKKKLPDRTSYVDLNFNPLILDQSTYDKLNDDYDPSMVDHRKRLAEWKKKEQERKELAEGLGVQYTPPTLKSPEEILKEYKFK